jgi:hypothetical protein
MLACLGLLLPRPAEQAVVLATKWLTGPITTVRDGHRLPKAVGVTRVRSSAWVWFSECISSDRVVHGNHPYSVRLNRDFCLWTYH